MKISAYLYGETYAESGEYESEVPVFSPDMLNDSTKFAD